jgi:hypothetical protein
MPGWCYGRLVQMIPEALADIRASQDLLKRAMKLSGLVATVFKASGP